MMTFFNTSVAQMNDYLVRMDLSQLDSLELSHLYSEVDPSLDQAAYSLSCSSLSGYTEWMALYFQQTVTLGWDWASENGEELRLRDGLLIRTNLMLQDHRGVDLGKELTLTHLSYFIARLEWQEVISKYIREQSKRFH